MRHRDRPPPRPQHLIDCDLANSGKLTRTAVRQMYKTTYDSWRNMKARAKAENSSVEPEFDDFVNFLRHMGPRPGLEFTIDRIDRITYGPENCRWLDKSGQANNRSSTIFLTHDGETLPLSEWAARTGQKRGTLAARRSRGLSPREIIYGKEKETGPLNFGKNPEQWKPWPYIWPADPEQCTWWENQYKRRQERDRNYPPEYPTRPFQWLISELKAARLASNGYIADNDEDPRPEIQAMVEKYRRRRDVATDAIARAEAIAPQWVAAVQTWNRQRQAAPDQHGEPHHDDEDDWDEADYDD